MQLPCVNFLPFLNMRNGRQTYAQRQEGQAHGEALPPLFRHQVGQQDHRGQARRAEVAVRR